MSKFKKSYLIVAIAFIVLVVGAFILIQEPFRNDTQKYLDIKRQTLSKIESQKLNNEQTKKIFDDASNQLDTVKCDEVDQAYRQECDSLKYKVKQAIGFINSNSSDSNKGYSLSQEILQLLKK